MEKACKKTIIYHDLLHDEFSTMEIHADPITKDYVYLRDASKRGKRKRFFLFHFFAKPIAWVYLKFKFHHEIVGKWKLKPYKKKAIFCYGNHTQIIGDALIPAFLVSPRYINVIVHPNNVFIPRIGKYVPLLGGLPLPGDKEAKQNFDEAIRTRVIQNQALFIYPEAHIWPYYTGIRPFSAESFIYPIKYGTPVFCFTNTYHARRKGKEVRIRTYIDGPFFCDESLPLAEAKEKLRNEVYQVMVERSELSSYQFIEYVKGEEK